jgi:hypothetical protein
MEVSYFCTAVKTGSTDNFIFVGFSEVKGIRTPFSFVIPSSLACAIMENLYAKSALTVFPCYTRASAFFG